MIDTHSHIYLKEFDADREAIIKNAQSAGIHSVFMPNIDAGTIQPMLDVEAAFPDICHAMIGLHPTSVKDDYREQLATMEHWLHMRHFAAIGEIGLDLYWDKSRLKEQKEVFRVQLEWAKETNLPVAIHVREAFDAVFEVLDKMYDERLKGVFHSFSGSFAEASRALSYPGFFLGINGIVTFRNSGLDTVLGRVGPKRLVTETDAPWLAPVPYRGKRNQPAYMVHTLKKLAEIFDSTTVEMTTITTQNARTLFK